MQLFVLCLLASFSVITITGYSQCDCNECDYVITETSDHYLFESEILAALNTDSLAGKKICIQGGQHGTITFRELITGKSGNPVIITNCGGLVTIDGVSTSGIRFWDSRYIKLVGNGCPNIEYGFRIKGGGNLVDFGITSVGYDMTDFEVAYLNIGGDSGTPGSAGLKMKLEPRCSDTQDRDDPNKPVMRNILIHHNYIHNVGTEGMYIGKGDDSYDGKEKVCNGQTEIVRSLSLRHVRIYDNIITDTGWDGLQLKDADEDVRVYNNIIRNFGIKNVGAQNEGLYLGSGVVGDVYRNSVINGTGNGFQYMGAGNLNFHSNIISNVGEFGIWGIGKYSKIDDPNNYVRILNNTIVKVGTKGEKIDGVHWQQYSDIHDVFVNNIVAEILKEQNGKSQSTRIWK